MKGQPVNQGSVSESIEVLQRLKLSDKEEIMEQQLVIKYDVTTCTLKIEENDFTTFEALGILEAAKAMISDDWLKED